MRVEFVLREKIEAFVLESERLTQVNWLLVASRTDLFLCNQDMIIVTEYLIIISIKFSFCQNLVTIMKF